MSPLSLQVLGKIDQHGRCTLAELVQMTQRPVAEIEAAVNSLRNARYIGQDGDKRWGRVESKTGLAVVRERAGRAAAMFDRPIGRRKCKACGIEKAAQAFLAAHEACRQCEQKSDGGSASEPEVPPPLVLPKVNGNSVVPPVAQKVIDDLVARREQLTADYNSCCSSINSAIEQIRETYGVAP